MNKKYKPIKHNLWYRIVRWLIRHSLTATAFVIEMRNEVADGYQWHIDRLEEQIREAQRPKGKADKEAHNG